MYKPIKCQQCGHEFTPERATKSGAWTPEEDELLLRLYQKERKLIAEIADELNRTQDATRNRLYLLRGGGKPKGVTASVQLTATEYDETKCELLVPRLRRLARLQSKQKPPSRSSPLLWQ